MERVSIEGRSRKQPSRPTPAGAKMAAGNALAAPSHLRPASPPKKNPWGRSQVTASDNAKFPPLPPTPAPEAPGADAARSQVSSPVSSPRTKTHQPDAAEAERRPMSACPDTARRIFRAAAPKAMANLWMHPFGADVIVTTDKMEFRVHRSIVQSESGWFRRSLPPPNRDGSPVHVRLTCASEAAGHCLLYMYTRKIDICEPLSGKAWDIAHLPRCVLAYSAAALLRTSSMAAHLVHIVETTSIDLGAIITGDAEPEMTGHNLFEFSYHLYNAMDILYGQGASKLLDPMKLAMAGVLDATLFHLLRHPFFVEVMRTQWRHMMPSICADQAKYRQAVGDTARGRRRALSDEATMKALFAEEEPRITNKTKENRQVVGYDIGGPFPKREQTFPEQLGDGASDGTRRGSTASNNIHIR